MTRRPMIMIVDDRPHGLAAMRDAIERRYGADYQVVAHESANAAVDELTRASVNGTEVALVIADQWMPELPGRELLRQVLALHPGAQRALVVGWGDTRASETILQGCAFGDLHNYILKPWDPAEVHLYPMVSEFLAEWTRRHGPRLELVRVIVEMPSPRGTELRDMLERNGVPFGAYAADSPAGSKMIEQVGIDRAKLPAIVTFDNRILYDPTNAELADALGVASPTDLTCDVAIVGGGPAGLAAAVYGASEGLRTIVIERVAVGGQAGESALIRNFLGFPRGITGADFAQRAYQQAWLFGAQYVLARRVLELSAEGAKRQLLLEDGRVITARAVVIATGAAYRRLERARIARFEGRGVYYYAGEDVARALTGQDLVVCGGGNSAGQAVVHLAKRARHLIHIVRGHSLSSTMSAYLIEEIMRLPNVELRLDTEAIDGDGADGLEQVTLRNRRTGATDVVTTPALFVMIGAVPHTDWLRDSIDCDSNGFVLTGGDLSPSSLDSYDDREPMLLETSMPGVFAAGDVRFGSTKRIASAAGEAAVAIAAIHEYFEREAASRPRPPSSEEAFVAGVPMH
jgi:thioredoxin reductase (NADPH)